MPQNTRNFWIEANIDGRNTLLQGGPASKTGGFDLTIYVRDDSGILQALQVSGLANANGDLTLRAWIPDNVDHARSVVVNAATDFEITTRR